MSLSDIHFCHIYLLAGEKNAGDPPIWELVPFSLHHAFIFDLLLVLFTGSEFSIIYTSDIQQRQTTGTALVHYF